MRDANAPTDVLSDVATILERRTFILNSPTKRQYPLFLILPVPSRIPITSHLLPPVVAFSWTSKSGGFMPISLHHFAAIAAITIAAGSTISVTAQAPEQQAASHPPTQPSLSEPAANPVADPKAVVIVGKARFTVLTPQLIRMEWAADGKFEDHASFVFINRRLPVPKFDRTELNAGTAKTIAIKTSALTLNYSPSGDGKFTAEQSLHPTYGRRQTRHMASRSIRSRKPARHYAHPRRRPRFQDEGAHRTGPRLSFWMGTRRRLHSPTLRLRRLSLPRGRKESVALGHRTPRRRPPGPVFLRVRPSTTLRHSETTLGSPAAFLFRHVSPSARGGPVIGHTATRKSKRSFAASTRTTSPSMSS